MNINKPAADCEWCDGQFLKIRKKQCSNGTAQFRWQCQRCGYCKGSSLSQRDIAGKWGIPPDFNENLQVRWRAVLQRYRRMKQLQSKRDYQEQRDEDKKKFNDWYRVYLTTPAWQFKRRLVLKRCSGICEGCCTAKAIVIHHRTYEHVGNELLFELVGLCEACHEIAHASQPKKEDGANDAA